jgi:DNA-binding Lrp family transcriptional regulator
VPRPPEEDKDRELVEILTADARLPLAEIAKRMGVSRATVQARLARLERDGVIAGYTVLRGRNPLSDNAISAIVLVEIDIKRQDEVVAALKDCPEIVGCRTTSGTYDLFVEVRCCNAARLDGLIDSIAAIDGVRKTTSSILLAEKFAR